MNNGPDYLTNLSLKEGDVIKLSFLPERVVKETDNGLIFVDSEGKIRGKVRRTIDDLDLWVVVSRS